MTPRILKKLSKRAAGLLPLVGYPGEMFIALKEDSYTSALKKEYAHPLKGTVMTGGMSGYYQPEWDEETAWETLQDIVITEFTDWRDPAKGAPILLRKLDTPREIFQAADDLIQGRRRS